VLSRIAMHITCYIIQEWNPVPCDPYIDYWASKRVKELCLRVHQVIKIWHF